MNNLLACTSEVFRDRLMIIDDRHKARDRATTCCRLQHRQLITLDDIAIIAEVGKRSSKWSPSGAPSCSVGSAAMQELNEPSYKQIHATIFQSKTLFIYFFLQYFCKLQVIQYDQSVAEYFFGMIWIIAYNYIKPLEMQKVRKSPFYLHFVKLQKRDFNTRP